ncbi:MAG: hypothetical protein ACI9DF_000490, partial [Verrucomicrobiales bacterium]
EHLTKVLSCNIRRMVWVGGQKERAAREPSRLKKVA